MAEKKIPLLYLETVETPQNESEEPCEAGNAPVAGLQERELLKGMHGGVGGWRGKSDMRQAGLWRNAHHISKGKADKTRLFLLRFGDPVQLSLPMKNTSIRQIC